MRCAGAAGVGCLESIVREKFAVGNREAPVFLGPMEKLETLTARLRAGEDLSPPEVREACAVLLDAGASDEGRADLLAALSGKGETAEEIGAFAEEFLAHALLPEFDRESLGKPLLDVCGTGGDKLKLFNVSTTGVFILAACGVAVAKHGNRGITSPSGGADVLEALGIRIDLPADSVGECLGEVGAAFLFAPLYHPAFKAVVPVRQLLAKRGQRTVFNLLGPLLNPARPDYQVLGLFDAERGPAFAEILGKLGRRRAWAVHGEAGEAGGMDELSTLGPTRVWETVRGTGGTGAPKRVDLLVEASSLGLATPSLEQLQGGDAAENASIVEGILEGTLVGPKRDLAALNAAAGLVVTGLAADLAEGLGLAAEALDSGKGREVLTRWRAYSAAKG